MDILTLQRSVNNNVWQVAMCCQHHGISVQYRISERLFCGLSVIGALHTCNISTSAVKPQPLILWLALFHTCLERSRLLLCVSICTDIHMHIYNKKSSPGWLHFFQLPHKRTSAYSLVFCSQNFDWQIVLAPSMSSQFQRSPTSQRNLWMFLCVGML